VHLALAGLSLQVAVIVIFCGFFGDYMVRYFRSGRAAAFGLRMKVFFGFLSTAILLILARCAYRCYELNSGYSGKLIRDEPLFIALEGVLIVLAVYSLCAGHPGLVFRKAREGNYEKEGETERSTESGGVLKG
jgi:RTA1 like protein